MGDGSPPWLTAQEIIEKMRVRELHQFARPPGSAKMPTRREMKAFELGEAAHGRAATLDDNPYPKYDQQNLPHPLHCMWLCGWTSADTDSPNGKLSHCDEKENQHGIS